MKEYYARAENTRELVELLGDPVIRGLVACAFIEGCSLSLKLASLLLEDESLEMEARRMVADSWNDDDILVHVPAIHALGVHAREAEDGMMQVLLQACLDGLLEADDAGSIRKHLDILEVLLQAGEVDDE